ncbi:AP2 domain transcription factor AP2X-6 [Toxoplasma gondii p89]|uniref:AP2 domain transcription factor AP2X-6 n=1 Tax=Toxoplasma gondii p89 TaxID=943119 RepID=A0A086KC44_TOXGO|nr:AP2 domain transcription factor AP2X-6 [Toxoplasma gondii p89]
MSAGTAATYLQDQGGNWMQSRNSAFHARNSEVSSFHAGSAVDSASSDSRTHKVAASAGPPQIGSDAERSGPTENAEVPFDSSCACSAAGSASAFRTEMHGETPEKPEVHCVPDTRIYVEDKKLAVPSAFVPGYLRPVPTPVNNTVLSPSSLDSVSPSFHSSVASALRSLSAAGEGVQPSCRSPGEGQATSKSTNAESGSLPANTETARQEEKNKDLFQASPSTNETGQESHSRAPGHAATSSGKLRLHARSPDAPGEPDGLSEAVGSHRFPSVGDYALLSENPKVSWTGNRNEHAYVERRSAFHSSSSVGCLVTMAAPCTSSAEASSASPFKKDLLPDSSLKLAEHSIPSDSRSENLEANRFLWDLSAKPGAVSEDMQKHRSVQAADSDEKPNAASCRCVSLSDSLSVSRHSILETVPDLNSTCGLPDDDTGVGGIPRQHMVYSGGLQLSLRSPLSLEDASDEDRTSFAFHNFSSPSLHTPSNKTDGSLWNHLGCSSTPCSSNGSKAEEATLSGGMSKAKEARQPLFFGASQETRFLRAGALSLEDTDCSGTADNGILSGEESEGASTSTHYYSACELSHSLSRDAVRIRDIFSEEVGEFLQGKNHFEFCSPSARDRKHTLSPTSSSRKTDAFSLSRCLTHHVESDPVENGASARDRGTCFFGVVCSCLSFCKTHRLSRAPVVNPVSCSTVSGACDSPCLSQSSHEPQLSGGDRTATTHAAIQKSCSSLGSVGEPAASDSASSSPVSHHEGLQRYQVSCPHCSSSPHASPFDFLGSSAFTAIHEEETCLEFPSASICMDSFHLPPCSLLSLTDSSLLRPWKSLNTVSGRPCSSSCSLPVAPLEESRASVFLPGGTCDVTSLKGDSYSTGAQSLPTRNALSAFSPERQERIKPGESEGFHAFTSAVTFLPSFAERERPSFEDSQRVCVEDERRQNAGRLARAANGKSQNEWIPGGSGMDESGQQWTASPLARVHPDMSSLVEENGQPQSTQRATDASPREPRGNGGSPHTRQDSTECESRETTNTDISGTPNEGQRETCSIYAHASVQELRATELQATKQERVGTEFHLSSANRRTPQDEKEVHKWVHGEAEQDLKTRLQLETHHEEQRMESAAQPSTASVAGLFCVDGALESPLLHPLPPSCLNRNTLAADNGAHADGFPIVPLPFLVYHVNASPERARAASASVCSEANAGTTTSAIPSSWHREVSRTSAASSSLPLSVVGDSKVDPHAVSPSGTKGCWPPDCRLEMDACRVPASCSPARERRPSAAPRRSRTGSEGVVGALLPLDGACVVALREAEQSSARKHQEALIFPDAEETQKVTSDSQSPIASAAPSETVGGSASQSSGPRTLKEGERKFHSSSDEARQLGCSAEAASGCLSLLPLTPSQKTCLESASALGETRSRNGSDGKLAEESCVPAGGEAAAPCMGPNPVMPLTTCSPPPSSYPPGHSTLPRLCLSSSDPSRGSITSTSARSTTEASTPGLRSALHEPMQSVELAPHPSRESPRFEAPADLGASSQAKKHSLVCDVDPVERTVPTPPSMLSDAHDSRSHPPAAPLSEPPQSEGPIVSSHADLDSWTLTPVAGCQMAAEVESVDQAQAQAPFRACSSSPFEYSTRSANTLVPCSSAREFYGSRAPLTPAGASCPQLPPSSAPGLSATPSVEGSQFRHLVPSPQMFSGLAVPSASASVSLAGCSTALPSADRCLAPASFGARGEAVPVFPAIRPGLAQAGLEAVGSSPRRTGGPRDEVPAIWDSTSFSGTSTASGAPGIRPAAFRPVFPSAPNMAVGARRSGAEVLPPRPSRSQSAPSLCPGSLLTSRSCPDLAPSLCAPPASFGASAPSPASVNSCRMSPPRVYHVVMCTRRYWRVEWVSPDTGRRVYKHFGENKYGGGEQAREVAMKFWDEVRRRSVDGVMRGEWAGLQEVTRRVREEGVDRILHEVASGGAGADSEASLQDSVPKPVASQLSPAPREGPACQEPRQNESEGFCGHQAAEAPALSDPQESPGDRSVRGPSREVAKVPEPPGRSSVQGPLREAHGDSAVGQAAARAQTAPTDMPLQAYSRLKTGDSNRVPVPKDQVGCVLPASQSPGSKAPAASSSHSGASWDGPRVPQKPIDCVEASSVLRDTHCDGGFPGYPRNLQSPRDEPAGGETQTGLVGGRLSETLEPRSEAHTLQVLLWASNAHAASRGNIQPPNTHSDRDVSVERETATDGDTRGGTQPQDRGPRGQFLHVERLGPPMQLLPKREDEYTSQLSSQVPDARDTHGLKTEASPSVMVAGERSADSAEREGIEKGEANANLSGRKPEWNVKEAEDHGASTDSATAWRFGLTSAILEQPPTPHRISEASGAGRDGQEALTPGMTAEGETRLPEKPATAFRGTLHESTASQRIMLSLTSCRYEKRNSESQLNTEETTHASFPLRSSAALGAENAGRSEVLPSQGDLKGAAADGDSLWGPTPEPVAMSEAAQSLWSSQESKQLSCSDTPEIQTQSNLRWSPGREQESDAPLETGTDPRRCDERCAGRTGQTLVQACDLDQIPLRNSGSFGCADRVAQTPYIQIQGEQQSCCGVPQMGHSGPGKEAQPNRQQEGRPEWGDEKLRCQTYPRSLCSVQLTEEPNADFHADTHSRLVRRQDSLQVPSLCQVTFAQEENKTATPRRNMASASRRTHVPGESSNVEEREQTDVSGPTHAMTFHLSESEELNPGLAHEAHKWASPGASEGPGTPQTGSKVRGDTRCHLTVVGGQGLPFESLLTRGNEPGACLHPFVQCESRGTSLWGGGVALTEGTRSVSPRQQDGDSSTDLLVACEGKEDSCGQRKQTCEASSFKPCEESGPGASGQLILSETADNSTEAKHDSDRSRVGVESGMSPESSSRKQLGRALSSEYSSPHKASLFGSELCPSTCDTTPVPSSKDRGFRPSSAPGSPLSSFLSSTAANSRATSPGSCRHPQSRNSYSDPFYQRQLPPSLSPDPCDLPRALQDPAFSQALLQLATNTAVKGERHSERMRGEASRLAASPLACPVESLQAQGVVQNAPEALVSATVLSVQPSDLAGHRGAAGGVAPHGEALASFSLVQESTDCPRSGETATRRQSQEVDLSGRQFAGTVPPATPMLMQSLLEPEQADSSASPHIASANAAIKNEALKEQGEKARNSTGKIETGVLPPDPRAVTPSVDVQGIHGSFDHPARGESPMGPSLGASECGSRSTHSVPFKDMATDPRLVSSTGAPSTPTVAPQTPLAFSRLPDDSAGRVRGPSRNSGSSLSSEMSPAFARHSPWPQNLASPPAASPRSSAALQNPSEHAAKRPAWGTEEANASPKYVLRGEDSMLSSPQLGVRAQASLWPASLSGAPSPRGFQLSLQQVHTREAASGVSSSFEALPQRQTSPFSLSHAAPESVYSSEGLPTQNPAPESLGVPYQQYTLLRLSNNELEKGEHAPLDNPTPGATFKHGPVHATPVCNGPFSASAGIRASSTVSSAPKPPFASSSGAARGGQSSGTSNSRHSTRTPGRIYSLLVRGVRCWRAEWHEKTSGQRRTRQYAAPKHGEERARAMCLWALCEANCVPVHLIKEAQERFGYDPRNRPVADTGGASLQAGLSGGVRLVAAQGGDSDVTKKRKRGPPTVPGAHAKGSQEASVSVGGDTERYRRETPGAQLRPQAWAEAYERNLREHPRDPETEDSMTCADGNALGVDLGSRHRTLPGDAGNVYLHGHCQATDEGAFSAHRAGDPPAGASQIHLLKADTSEPLSAVPAHRPPTPYCFSDGTVTHNSQAPEYRRSFAGTPNMKTTGSQQKDPEAFYGGLSDFRLSRPRPFSESSGLNEQSRQPLVTLANSEMSDGQDSKLSVVKATADIKGIGVTGLQNTGSVFYGGGTGSKGLFHPSDGTEYKSVDPAASPTTDRTVSGLQTVSVRQGLIPGGGAALDGKAFSNLADALLPSAETPSRLGCRRSYECASTISAASLGNGSDPDITSGMLRMQPSDCFGEGGLADNQANKRPRQSEDCGGTALLHPLAPHSQSITGSCVASAGLGSTKGDGSYLPSDRAGRVAWSLIAQGWTIPKCSLHRQRQPRERTLIAGRANEYATKAEDVAEEQGQLAAQAVIAEEQSQQRPNRYVEDVSDDCLSYHNYYRSEDLDYPLLPLQFSQELLDMVMNIAQSRADGNCSEWGHSNRDLRPGAAENLYGTFEDPPRCERGVYLWFEEYREFQGTYPGTNWTDWFHLVVGHFTQLMWHSARYMACARTRGCTNDNNQLFCLYMPAGNIAGQAPFSRETWNSILRREKKYQQYTNSLEGGMPLGLALHPPQKADYGMVSEARGEDRKRMHVVASKSPMDETKLINFSGRPDARVIGTNAATEEHLKSPSATEESLEEKREAHSAEPYKREVLRTEIGKTGEKPLAKDELGDADEEPPRETDTKTDERKEATSESKEQRGDDESERNSGFASLQSPPIYDWILGWGLEKPPPEYLAKVKKLLQNTVHRESWLPAVCYTPQAENFAVCHTEGRINAH